MREEYLEEVEEEDPREVVRLFKGFYDDVSSHVKVVTSKEQQQKVL